MGLMLVLDNQGNVLLHIAALTGEERDNDP